MNPVQLERLRDHLTRLRLLKSRVNDHLKFPLYDHVKFPPPGDNCMVGARPSWSAPVPIVVPGAV